MINSLPYIIISIVGLVVVVFLVFFTRRKERANRLSTLAGLAFAFIIAGIMFGENRFLGYSLLAVGVVLAVADIFVKSKPRQP
jgi:uncharacterized membrane protein